MNVAIKSQHKEEVSIWFFCPGCEDRHRVVVAGKPSVWGWNDSLEKPTFTPSILVQYGNNDGDKRCHSFVKEGQIEYLNDCTHKLAGQTVPLPPIE